MTGTALPPSSIVRAQDGLRALAELVNDILWSRVTPVLAGQVDARPAGPRVVRQSALESTQVVHKPARPGRSGGRVLQPAPDPGRDDAVEVEAEHVETWRLVELAQAGDGEAFGALYDRYVDTVFRFIYFRVNDRALAEDFTSETFLRALRRISTISYQGRDIGAWFVTIARNIVFDHSKSARHRLEVTTADTVEGRERAASTESAVLEALTNESLMAAVARLGDEQRECVMLRFIQGMSVNETAEIMGKNDGAIKALQHRAIKKLAELVGDDLR